MKASKPYDKIVKVLKGKDPLTTNEICNATGLSYDQVKRQLGKARNKKGIYIHSYVRKDDLFKCVHLARFAYGFDMQDAEKPGNVKKKMIQSLEEKFISLLRDDGRRMIIADVVKELSVNSSLARSIIKNARTSYPIRICDYLKKNTQKIYPVYEWGNKADEPNRYLDEEEDAIDFDSVMSAATVKAHEEWKKTWIPKPDPAAAWMMRSAA